MENLKIKVSDKNYNLVHGSTTINHRIRVKLGLTCDEYVIADYFARFAGKMSYEEAINEVKKQAGFTATEIIHHLGKVNMILEQDWINKVWLKEFDTSVDFEEFWNIFQKTGNRQKSLDMYNRTRKVVSKEILHERAKKYVAFRLKQFGELSTHASSYCNPKNKMWEDVLPDDNKPAPDKMEGTIFK